MHCCQSWRWSCACNSYISGSNAIFQSVDTGCASKDAGTCCRACSRCHNPSMLVHSPGRPHPGTASQWTCPSGHQTPGCTDSTHPAQSLRICSQYTATSQCAAQCQKAKHTCKAEQPRRAGCSRGMRSISGVDKQTQKLDDKLKHGLISRLDQDAIWTLVDVCRISLLHSHSISKKERQRTEGRAQHKTGDRRHSPT